MTSPLEIDAGWHEKMGCRGGITCAPVTDAIQEFMSGIKSPANCKTKALILKSYLVPRITAA